MVSASTNLPKYIDEYTLPTPHSGPLAITVDKQGTVWFTESNSSKLGRFDPTNNTFKEYLVPGVGDMWGVAVEKSGQVWFTQYSGRGSVNPGGAIVPGGQGRLVRFSPINQNFTFVDVPTPGVFPMRLIMDKDNRVWFSEFLGNKIGVYDQSSNRLVEYDVPTNASGPSDLFLDQKGTLWFSESYAQKVARFYPENRSFVEYSVASVAFSPVGIAVDDARVWFADHGGNWIAELRLNTQELIRYPTHHPSKYVSFLSIPNGLLMDLQGRLWFTEHGGNSIAYFNPKTQTMAEFPIPTGPISTALWLALAPNGDIWFTEWYTSKIGVVHTNLPVPLDLRVSQSYIPLRPGEQTSISVLTKTSKDIPGNGTFRYSWSSYNPEEVSVIFIPQYPILSSDVPARADLKLSSNIRPANYTLGLGIDAGTVLVWTMIPTQVIQPKPASTPIVGLIILVFLLVLVLAAVGALLLRTRHRLRTSSD